MSIVYSFTGIFIGLFAIVAWWFAMFSDGVWGDLAREGLSGIFSLGRNTIAVIEPAVGGFMLFGGCGLLTDATGGEDSFLSDLYFLGCLVSLVVAVLGLVPVRLPGWMYPEWHEERRWRRAQQAEWEARYGSKDEGDGRTD